MCQAKLEGESVSRDLRNSEVKEYIANLAREISRQNVKDANWLILVAYGWVLQKKAGAGSQKRMDQSSSKFSKNRVSPNNFFRWQRILKVGTLDKISNQGLFEDILLRPLKD